jgi:hypothetical protein
MKLHARKHHPQRRKADFDTWEKTIDALAMSICPSREWQDYERRLQQLAWRANVRSRRKVVSVFPVWKKYRQKALRVATLHQAVPVLKYLPLRVSCLLGDLLFK